VGTRPIPTLGGRHYYVSFTDDKTSLTYLHLLRQKSEVLDAYKGFEAWCKISMVLASKPSIQIEGENIWEKLLLHTSKLLE
jgi:hypothetical protein